MQGILFSKKDIGSIANTILEKSSKIIALNGPMGAGKTTLITEMVRQLGAVDIAHSPTFGLVNEYADHEGRSLAYHFDFYRMEDEMEALDMGIEDYFNQDCHIFMEWSEKIPNLLPAHMTTIFLKIIGPEMRELHF
jgi:tRNA threonylcarbamoyladenosine biosynthesis protein TsaE